ncbi:MAG: hypothetical protein V9E99_08065 [Microthrixaceae bacterium]
MAQLTIRGSDELISRVKSSAADVGRSMNDYVISILDAATNPDLFESPGVVGFRGAVVHP